MASAKNYLLFSLILHSSKCLSQNGLEGFAIGGEHASIAAYPHSAFLSAQCDITWICGSAILNQKILLTAAHCVHGCDLSNGSSVQVLIGSANLREARTKRIVSKMLIHSEYDENSIENDIALTLLDRSIPLGKNVKRVIISNTFPSDVKGYVAGWGVIDEVTEEISVHLKHIEQRLRSVKTCALIGPLLPSMFCAGSTEMDASHPAEGDSGSGLMTSSFIEIGIVSFRTLDYPALLVYSNVTYYYKWVKHYANILYCMKK